MNSKIDPAIYLFNHVFFNYPDIWNQMQVICRPHKMSSIIHIFRQHLENIEDLQIFNENVVNIPTFLLEFCKTIRRNFLSPGDSYGILLTCRLTKIYTQDTLDKRHLRDQLPALKNCSYNVEKDLRFEVNIYTSLNQIYEITNKRKFTTLFVRNCEIEELLKIAKDETCYLSIKNENNKAENFENGRVYVSLKKFIIVDSFVDDYFKIICHKLEDKDYVFRHINQSKIVCFTDLKFVFKKCGIISYFFNLIHVIKFQFFKTMNPSGRNYKDISSIIKYQCCTGEPLPLNRNGLRKNKNRSGLEKLCFEAVKQNYVFESIKTKKYSVNDSVSKIYFGQQFNEGSGYQFEIINKE